MSPRRRQAGSPTSGGDDPGSDAWDLRDALALVALSLPEAEAGELDSRWRAELAATTPADRPGRLRELLVGSGGAPVGVATARRRLRSLAHQVTAARLPLVWSHLYGGESGGPTLPRVEVRLLGALQIEVAFGPRRARPRWRGRQPWLALAALVAAGNRPLSRRALAAALWPDSSESGEAEHLPPVLSHLRRALRAAVEEVGGAVVPSRLLTIGPGSVALGPGVEWWSDVQAFERAQAEGEIAEREGRLPAAVLAWESALQLYQGPLLAGLAGELGWVEERRQMLERKDLGVLRDLGTLYTRSDQVTAAIDAYRRCLLAEPAQEPVHVALMRLYGRLGRRDLVRRQFQRLCSLLLDGLGVEPLPETVSEYHRLMAGT